MYTLCEVYSNFCCITQSGRYLESSVSQLDVRWEVEYVSAEGKPSVPSSAARRTQQGIEMEISPSKAAPPTQQHVK